MRAGQVTADSCVDSCFPIERPKEVAIVAKTLRCPQQKESVWFEGVVEGCNDLFLKWLIEVDQHVAAKQQVNVGERRIRTQVLAGKDAAIANAL